MENLPVNNNKTLLSKLSNQIAITNKLFLPVKQSDMMELFSEYPFFFLKNICKFYPFSFNEIEKNKYKLDWYWLGSNENIDWSQIPIDTFIEMYDQAGADRLTICHNKKIPWTIELIEKHIDFWDWSDYGLSHNDALPWSFELLRKFEDRFIWSELSSINLNWSTELLEAFDDKWNWEELSYNETLPWSKDLLAKYLHKFNFGYLCLNSKVPWDETLIEKYREKINWDFLSFNEGLTWYESLIEKYEDFWNWKNLSKNTKLPWTEAFIKKYSEFWDWDRLSINPALPWSTDFISKYFKKWNFKKISQNTGLPWNEVLIDAFLDRWGWGSNIQNDSGIDSYDEYQNKGLCYNESIPWDINLIKKYSKFIEWSSLRHNSAFKWSINKINVLKELIEWGGFNLSENVWLDAFSDTMDKEIVDKILNEIDYLFGDSIDCELFSLHGIRLKNGYDYVSSHHVPGFLVKFEDLYLSKGDPENISIETIYTVTLNPLQLKIIHKKTK